MNIPKNELNQARRKFKRRESDNFLSNLKNILSFIEDYQKGKISNLKPILAGIQRQPKKTLGGRQEDNSLEATIISHIERILLDMINNQK